MFLYKHAFYFELLHCLRTLSCLFIMRCCFLSTGSSFLFVNTSGRYGGQRAQLLLPPLRENDTHCLSFLFYQVGGREGAVPATLNVYIKGAQEHWGRLVSVGGALRWWRCVCFLQRTIVLWEFLSLTHQALPTTSGRGWSLLCPPSGPITTR